MTGGRSRDRPRRWIRAALTIGVGLASSGAGVALWLLRDPVPGFAERRSTLVGVEEGPSQETAGLVSRRARLRAASGVEVDLVVRSPAMVAETREAAPLGPTGRPMILILGGHRTGEDAALLVDDTGGAVVAAMGYPYDGPVDISGAAVLRHVPRIRRALLDTPPAVALALDHLLALPEVDSSRVELVGVSLGAYLAPAAAALDPRVTRLWLIHGSGRPRELIERGLERHVPTAVLRRIVAALTSVLFSVPRLAPEVWVPRVAPRPVVMVNSVDDERLPRAAVEALYRSAREPKEQIWLTGPHVQPNRPEVVQELLRVVQERVAHGPLPDPRRP